MKYLVALLFFCFFSHISFSQFVEKMGLIYGNASYNIFIIKFDSTLSKGFQIIDKESLFSKSIANNGSFFAINPGPVDPDCNLLGLLIKDGAKVQSINRTFGSGNFYMQPNGFMGFKKNNVEILRSEKFDDKSDWENAFQSGPMLVYDNKINSNFDPLSLNKNIRSGVGLYLKNSIRYLVFAISTQSITFFQIANLFSNKFNCANALSLESGDAAFMHLPSDDTSNNSLTSCNSLFYSLP